MEEGEVSLVSHISLTHQGGAAWALAGTSARTTPTRTPKPACPTTATRVKHQNFKPHLTFIHTGQHPTHHRTARQEGQGSGSDKLLHTSCTSSDDLHPHHHPSCLTTREAKSRCSTKHPNASRPCNSACSARRTSSPSRCSPSPTATSSTSTPVTPQARSEA